MSSEEHKAKAVERGPVAVGIVTVSDTRTEADDTNGQYLTQALAQAGHTLALYRILPDEPEQVA